MQEFCGEKGSVFTFLSQSIHDATWKAVCKQVKYGLVNKLLADEQTTRHSFIILSGF
jgi:hypothetical protein